MTTNSNVIEKIRTLISISKSNNVNVASSAARKADELIKKFNLSNIQFNQEPENNSDPVIQSDHPIYECARVQPWKEKLVYYVAENCIVLHFSEKGSRKTQYVLVGKKNNIEKAHKVFEEISMKTQNLCKSVCKDRGHVASYSWCEGAIEGFAFNRKKNTYAQVEEENLNTSFVVADNSNRKIDNSFFEAGFRMGCNFSYNAF